MIGFQCCFQDRTNEPLAGSAAFSSGCKAGKTIKYQHKTGTRPSAIAYYHIDSRGLYSYLYLWLLSLKMWWTEVFVDAGFLCLRSFVPSRDIKLTGHSILPGGNPINRSAYGLLHTLFYTFNQNWCNLLPGVHLLPRLFGCNRYLAQTFIKSKKDERWLWQAPD